MSVVSSHVPPFWHGLSVQTEKKTRIDSNWSMWQCSSVCISPRWSQLTSSAGCVIRTALASHIICFIVSTRWTGWRRGAGARDVLCVCVQNSVNTLKYVSCACVWVILHHHGPIVPTAVSANQISTSQHVYLAVPFPIPLPTPHPLTVHCMSLCAAHVLQRWTIHTVYKGQPIHYYSNAISINSPHHTRVSRWNTVSHCIGSAIVSTDCGERRTTIHMHIMHTTLLDCHYIKKNSRVC